MEKYIYMVRVCYSSEDYEGIDTHIHKTFNGALANYNNLIEIECSPTFSWVGEYAFDENGRLNEGYEIDNTSYEGKEKDLLWEIRCKYDWYRRITIQLLKLEVKE